MNFTHYSNGLHFFFFLARKVSEMWCWGLKRVLEDKPGSQTESEGSSSQFNPPKKSRASEKAWAVWMYVIVLVIWLVPFQCVKPEEYSAFHTFKMPLNKERNRTRMCLQCTNIEYKAREQTNQCKRQMEIHARHGHASKRPWWEAVADGFRLPLPVVWNSTCPFCGALLLLGESKMFCCNNGARKVLALPPLPDNIRHLLQNPAYASKASDISWLLNYCFCFTAIGVMNGFAHFTSGPHAVAITGRTYHHMLDTESEDHSIHWFLYDEREWERHGAHWGVNIWWIRAFQADLLQVNPYVSALWLFETITPEDTTAIELDQVAASGDFAAIICSSNSCNISPWNIVIWHRHNQQPTFINILSRHYEPLQYPLLFPHGTPGWGLDTNSNNINGLTQIEWYHSRLFTEDQFQIFGWLGCKYLCDVYSQVEEQCLQYIRSERINQAKHSQAADDKQGDVHFELPASFVQSRAWASEKTADVLTLARHWRKPSLFMTMTTNVHWPEIQSRLQPGQTAYDIPIIVIRVLCLQLKWLMKLLCTKFGQLVYIIKVVKFQKRGLPHAHIVLKVSTLYCEYIFKLSLVITRLILKYLWRRSTNSFKLSCPETIPVCVIRFNIHCRTSFLFW